MRPRAKPTVRPAEAITSSIFFGFKVETAPLGKPRG